MPAINDTTFRTIVALASNASLDSPNQPNKPLSLQLPEQSLAAGNFSISISADTSVSVINEKTDPDPFGFFNLGTDAKKAAEKDNDAPTIEPPAAFDSNLAYVVVSGLNISGKISGKFTIGGSGELGLDGSDTLDTGVCMAFPRTKPVLEAIGEALVGFKTMFLADEVQRLSVWGEGSQILTFGSQGNLTLSLTVTASTLAAVIASSIKASLGQEGPIEFSTDVSAALKANFSTADGFRIFAHRAAAGAVTFGIKKDASTTLGLTGSAGIKVGFDDAEINSLVNAAFERIAGLASGELNTLLSDTTQSPRIQEILQKLNLTDTLSTGIDTLKKKLSDLRDALIKQLTPTLSAQFSYTWKRLTSDSFVAQFIIPDAQIPAYHADILGLDIGRIIKQGPADGIVITKMLGRSETNTGIGFGFSFGLNDYTFLKSWDSLERKFVEMRKLAQNGDWARQYSFLGKRAYESSWFGRSQTNYVELDASTDGFSVGKPAVSDFQLGLSVAFTWKAQTFKDILDTVADHGCLITALGTDDVLAAKQLLVSRGVDPSASGEALVSLSLDDLAFRRLIDVLAGSEYLDRLAPNALARSLCFTSDYPERSKVTRRMQVYGQVFRNFLGAEELSLDLVSFICRDVLPRITNGGKVSPNLVRNEFDSRMNAWTAQGTVVMADQSSLQEAVNHDLRVCFDLLQRSSGNFQKVFPAVVDNFSTLAAQSYGCRVISSLIVLAAMITPGGLNQLSRTVQFTWTDNGQAHTVVCKPS